MPQTLLLLVLACMALGAAEGTARSIPLPAEWQFRLDPKDEGTKAKWEAVDTDLSAWRTLRVPGPWEAQLGREYNGVGWYRCTFTLPADAPSGPVFLCLPVIDENDEAFCNGIAIGATRKDWTNPRCYRIDAEVLHRDRDNVIVVKVTDNYGGGGMSRGRAAVIIPGAIVAEADPHDRTAAPIALDLVPGEADHLAKAWTYGWRDEGTSAANKMKVQAIADAWNGEPALALDIVNPRSAGEYVQCRLPRDSDGDEWFDQGMDYLVLRVRSGVEGDLRVCLSPNGFTWTQKSSQVWNAAVTVTASPDWQEVVLPFAFFTREDRHGVTVLPDPRGLYTVSLGYRNNEIREAGRLEVAGFAVGRFLRAPERLDLETIWHGRPDPEDRGLSEGWATSALAADEWAWLAIGTPWERADRSWAKIDGVAWLRQRVRIPEAWAGRPLFLSLGEVADFQDLATCFVNGEAVAAVDDPRRSRGIQATLPPELVQSGWADIAVRVTDAGMHGGLTGGPFRLEAPAVELRLREGGSSGAGVLPGAFDIGSRLGKPVDLLFLCPGTAAADLDLSVEVRDCFHHVLARTSVPIVDGRAVVSLAGKEARLLHWSENLRARGILRRRSDGRVHSSFSLADEPLDLASRDRRRLDPLPELIEDTPYGRLRLIDVIDASVDPAVDPHPYKQGGIRQSWVGRRAYSSWEEGIQVREWEGRRYREAGNNEWFAYRVGRGDMKAHGAYVVRVVYPENTPRYFVMNIDAGRNYQGTGFRSGLGADNPYDPYPLSGRYEIYDHIVINDDTTWGQQGSRTAASDHGFWITFFDVGRCYAGDYPAGPAVAEIRVYAIDDVEAALPRIDLPKGAPQRWLSMDWEHEIESPAPDAVAYARLMGFNAISPSVLKWGSLAWWRTGLDLRHVDDIREPLADGVTPAYERYLDATRAAGLAIIPRIEPTGSEAIPADERAIGANGKPAVPNRFARWCADLTQPTIQAEFDTLVDELVASRIQDHPQIAGLLWRIRSDRFPISYGAKAVALFCTETGRTPPTPLDDATSAKWATSKDLRADYETWWHGKRLAFHQHILARLRQADPDQRLWYYNWDPDGWKLGESFRSAQDYTDWYDLTRANLYYERKTAHQRTHSAQDYLDMLLAGPYGGQPHHQVRTDLYRDQKGISMVGPLQWHYLADNAPYLQHWDSDQGASLSVLMGYEEKSRWNVQGDKYESSELTPGGPAFSMAYEIGACYHLDPESIFETTYTYGRGFSDQFRRFAQAYLALPAVKGGILPGGDADLRVRRYDAAGGTWLGVVHKGFAPRQAQVRLPGPWPEGLRCRDLVSGADLPLVVEGGDRILNLDLAPMELRSFRLEAP